MFEITIVFIVFASILVGVAIVCWTIVRLVGGPGPRASQQQEPQIIQEVYQGLTRMEQRVEALETLLLEQEKKGGSHAES